MQTFPEVLCAFLFPFEPILPVFVTLHGRASEFIDCCNVLLLTVIRLHCSQLSGPYYVYNTHSTVFPFSIFKVRTGICSVSQTEIRLNGEFAEEYICSTRGTSATSPEPQESEDFDKDDTKNVGGREYNLSELAFLRSGDKGDTANIGVVARHPSLLPYIRKALTRKVLEDYFYHKVKGTKPIIKRYDLPGVSGLNFVLPNSLGGGGIASLSVDPQGKAFAQVLADFKVALPSDMKLENLDK